MADLPSKERGKSRMFEPGDTVGNFEIIRRLSAGGMATLYLARRVGAAGFARPVALKVIHPHLAMNPEFATMFVDEANISARIDHPNVVRVEELMQLRDTGTLVLAMEYVEGTSLGQLVRALVNAKERLSAELAVYIVAQVAAGLHAAHETTDEMGRPLDTVHRDVSPHNILIARDGHVKVIDFGIAKAAQRHQSTDVGMLKGKVRFMSPEQARAASVDRRSDIFSLGVILWELLTLQKLFDGPTDAHVLTAVMNPRAAPPTTVGGRGSAALDVVVLQALALQPSDRPETALAFRRRLLDAVPLAQLIEAGELAALMAATVPRIDSMWPRPSAGRHVHHDIAPPSSDVLGSAIIEGLHVEVQGVDTNRSSHEPEAERTAVSEPLVIAESKATLMAAGRDDRGLPPARGRFPWTLAGALVVVVLFASAVFAMRTADSRAPARAAPPPLAIAPSAPPPPPVPATCGKDMVEIPSGNFFMGSDDKDDFPFEKPAHKVTITRPYCMDVYETTTEDYKRASDRGDVKRGGQVNEWEGISATERRAYDPLCNLRAPEDRRRHPINCVSWELADSYCKALNKRLPTEAEWEYAARGPDGRTYPWGDELPNASLLNACGKECTAWGKQNHIDPTGIATQMYPEDDGWAATAPVGSYPKGKSRYGLQDVVGNVWEWVADWYAPYAASAEVDPVGPSTGNGRVVRGGAWNGAMPGWVRPTFRFHYAPTLRSHGVGFRCASSL